MDKAAQKGIAHLILLIIIGVIVIGAGLLIIPKLIFNKQPTKSTQVSQGSSDSYSNFDEGLSIRTPKNWRLVENSDARTQATFFAPKEGQDDKFIENVSLYISDLSAKPNVTLAEIVSAWINQSKSEFPDSFEVISQESASLGGVSAVKIVANAKDDVSPLKSMALLALKDGKSYILNYSAEEKSFAKFLPEVESLINSFKLEAQKVTWETYTSEQYGYTVKIPSGWKVTDTPSETSREISIVHPQAKALVLITALKDANLKDIDYMKSSIAQFKEKLENDPSITKLGKFTDKVEGSVGMFAVRGLEKREGAEWYFEQRGILSTAGKVVLFHGAAQSTTNKAYADVISEIIESFKTD